MTEALTVIGSFEPVDALDSVDRFFSDTGDVLDTNLFGGRRCPSEQTALSLWRIARWRVDHGDTDWGDVAERAATWVARRVAGEADGLPVHDLLGKGETHTRFLADAALLLAADGRFPQEEHRAHDALAALAATGERGPWYRHDSVEADTRQNHLVLNTHVHTMVARAASGLPIDDALVELERVLLLRGESRRGMQAAGIAVADGLRSTPVRVLRERGWRLSERVHHSAARSRARRSHLVLPGGWLARDVLAVPTPSYLTVNLHDLAVLSRIVESPVVARALRRGVTWARATGFFRAQRIARDPLVVLVPALLRNAGQPRAAARAAFTLRAAGYTPCLGWPGYEDHRWSRLPAGTP